MDSKYSAALLLPAIGLFLLVSARPWLRRWQPWAGGALALLLFLPVVAWNAAHGWASFAKQGGRADDWQPARAFQFLAELLLGQFALATPIIAVLCVAGILLALRRWREPRWALLAALSALPALVFLQHAIGDRVQANWPAVIYPAAAIAAAGIGRGWLRPGLALGFAMTALVWLQGVWSPLPLPMRLDPTLLRLGGWQQIAAELDAAAAREQAAFVVADNYGLAALMARLMATPAPVLGVEARWAYFDLPDAQPITDGKTGLLLRSARRAGGPDPADWSEITEIGTLQRARNGMTAEGFRLYRVVGRRGPEPIVRLPRPG